MQIPIIPLPGDRELDLNVLLDMSRRSKMIAGGIAAFVLLLSVGLVASLTREPDIMLTAEVSSTPPGATVSFDASTTVVGTTPLVLPVPRGTTAVVLRAPGYLDYRIPVKALAKPVTAAMLLSSTIIRPKHNVPGQSPENIAMSYDGSWLQYTVGRTHWTYNTQTMAYEHLPLLDLTGGLNHSLSPDRSRSFYLRREGGGTRISMVNLADRKTRDLLQLSSGDGRLNDIRWIDSKTLMAGLSRDSEGQGRLVTIDVDTNQVTVLVSVPTDVQGGPYIFSPDRSKVSFMLTAGNPVIGVAFMREPGRFFYVGDVAVANTNTTFVSNPSAWSADGSKLYFIAPRSDVPTSSNGFVLREAPTLWVSTLSGPPRKAVSYTGMPGGDPWMSVIAAPDNTLIVGYRDESDPSSLRLFRMWPDGSGYVFLRGLAIEPNAAVQILPATSGHLRWLVLNPSRSGALDTWFLAFE